MKSKTIFTVLLLILGCGCMRNGFTPYEIDGESVQKVEIYSRNFMTLSYLPYTESNLLKHHDKKMIITDLREIRRLVDELPKECIEDVSVSPEKMNLYVVIIFYGKKKRLDDWQYSKFQYYKRGDGHPCKIDDAQRMRVERVLASLRPENKP